MVSGELVTRSQTLFGNAFPGNSCFPSVGRGTITFYHSRLTTHHSHPVDLSRFMMHFADPAYWSDYLRQTLRQYNEPLLRRVAAHLFKPRSQWPPEDLIERCLATLSNAAVIDRRLQDLEMPARRVLACMGHSRQPRWKLSNLLELLAVFGCSEGPQAVFRIFEAGLLYPDLPALGTGPWVVGSEKGILQPEKDFEQWLGQGGVSGFAVFAHPLVTARALGTDLGLPACDSVSSLPGGGLHEADGLEWPLRLAALWQLVDASPLRRTQQGGFFKRDLDRLRSDPLLNAPPPDNPAILPDAGLLIVSLAQGEGLVLADQEELRAGSLPLHWDAGLSSTVASLWSNLLLLETWNPLDGWCGSASVGNPYPSAYLLLFLLLANVPEESWADPAHLEQWLLEHHPYWKGVEREAQSAERRKAAPFAFQPLVPLRSPLRAPRSGVAPSGRGTPGADAWPGEARACLRY